jgi:hypothetical protein
VKELDEFIEKEAFNPYMHEHEKMIPVGKLKEFMEGKAIMPLEITSANGAKSLMQGEFHETTEIICLVCSSDDDNECEYCKGSEELKISITVKWTTIKDMYAKLVNHFNNVEGK